MGADVIKELAQLLPWGKQWLAAQRREKQRPAKPQGLGSREELGFQGEREQLPPAAPLQMAAGSATVSLERERFPREKGRFKPRRSHGCCCQADSRLWFLAGIYFLERTESSQERPLVLLLDTEELHQQPQWYNCQERKIIPPLREPQAFLRERNASYKFNRSKPSQRHPAHRTSPQLLLL